MFRKNVLPVILAVILKPVYSDIFSATVNFESLLNTEEFVIKILKDYIKAEERKLSFIKRHLNTFKVNHGLATQNDAKLYFYNPINAYILVKRLTSDWEEIKTLISTNVNSEAIKNISKDAQNFIFPKDEDLNGVAVALTRLQDTYQLNVSSLAEGQIKGTKCTQKLAGSDCFEIGRQSFINGDCYHTWKWMNEARRKLQIEDIIWSPFKEKMLEYMAVCAHQRGDTIQAFNLTRELLKLSPKHARANHDLIYYEDELSKAQEELDERYDVPKHENVIKNPHAIDPYSQEFYQALCRGDIESPLKNSSRLKCRYIKRTNPFLIIAPFKVEEAHLQPDILIFYDVISNEEIEILKKLAVSKLARASVIDPNTGKLQYSNERISQSAWIHKKDHPLIRTLTQRITDITGLSMKSAENFQVANYGTGGFYNAHYDFVQKALNVSPTFKKLGNRIATVLIYMSDVELGGATVFPLASTTLWPKKGTAAFWYNLFPSGDGDARTWHAACPVLVGSKWISNKWIHERDQEFLRPCTRERPLEKWII